MSAEILDHLSALAPLFCRVFGALALLPLEKGLSGLMLRFSLSSAGALFLSAIIKSPGGSSGLELLAEFALGALLSLPALLVCSSCAMLGEIFDVARGQNVAELYDPAGAKGSSLCAEFFERFAAVLLFSAGLFDRMLSVLAQSFTVIVKAAGWRPGQEGLLQIVELIAMVLGQFCLFFLPLLLAFSLVDLVFGYAAKLLPQVSMQSEIMLAKSAAGFFLLMQLSRQECFGRLMALADPGGLEVLFSP